MQVPLAVVARPPGTGRPTLIGSGRLVSALPTDPRRSFRNQGREPFARSCQWRRGDAAAHGAPRSIFGSAYTCPPSSYWVRTELEARFHDAINRSIGCTPMRCHQATLRVSRTRRGTFR